MKLAIIGSRSLFIEKMEDYLPKNVVEIITGGAKGIDQCAKEYAISNNIKLVEFLPNYNKYGKVAPIIRNKQIVEYADMVLAFWDGSSKGTSFVIDYARQKGKEVLVIYLSSAH